MNSWWRAFYSQFTPQECDEIIAYGLTHNPIQGTIGHGGKSIVDTEYRQSTIRWFNRSDPKLAWLYMRIEHLCLKANAEAFGFDVHGFTDVQFTEYDGSVAGHYNWHEDNNWKRNTPYDRKISMVIQLSKPEDYKGGKLQLHNDPLPDNVFVNQGDVILFPSFNRHQVTSVTEGKRYSLVTWFVGPKFR